MLPVVGHSIYNKDESFSCGLLKKTEFSHLLDVIWALSAHELLSSANKGCGLFLSSDPLSIMPLKDRVKTYCEIGKNLQPQGTLALSTAIRQLSNYQRDYIEKIRKITEEKNSGVV
jgi:hypothetical protein